MEEQRVSIHNRDISTKSNARSSNHQANIDDSNVIGLLDSIRPEINKLIAKQRLLRLAEGDKFSKYTPKGQRLKDKFWFCKLSTNNRFLHYGDYDETREQNLDELPNKINVKNFKKLLTRRECPFMKDMHSKRATVDLAFTLVYESDYEDNLNFVAPDSKTFCIWTDGLNALLKQGMVSGEAKRDFEILSGIELKMRSL